MTTYRWNQKKQCTECYRQQTCQRQLLYRAEKNRVFKGPNWWILFFCEF